MKVKRIFNPAKGERVIAVDPEMKLEVGADWRRRLNFYTGRSLSDVALTTEQTGRDGRLALRGQMMSAGVISGLEAALELDQSGNYFYHLLGGTGVAASGEDVVMVQEMRVNVFSTLVFFPAGLSGLGGRESLKFTLRRLIDEGVNLPRAGVLMLQPVTAELIGRLNPADECEIDPTNDAFDDWQSVDATRLVLYIWPDTPATKIPLPPLTPAATWRNRIAHTIFEAEKALTEDELMPWNELGVPVGVVGFADDWTPLFLDRYAVVRAGGKPQRRRPLRVYSPRGSWEVDVSYRLGDVVTYNGLAYRALQDHTSLGSRTPFGSPDLWQLAGSGNPFLWQARVQQFTDQISEATHDNVAYEDLRHEYRYLPPAGLLPREVINPREGATEDLFFPPAYAVDAVPIPLEQLDAAIEGSASLDPFDLNVPDRIRVLVPVPQVWYESTLLQTETIDPEFAEALNEFITRRGRWLTRREYVRDIIRLLTKVITGTSIVYPDPDPGKLEETEEEFVQVDPDCGDEPNEDCDEKFRSVETDYGTVVGEDDERIVTLIEELRAFLLSSTPLRSTPARVAFPDNFDITDIPGLRYERDANQQGFLVFTQVMDETERENLRGILKTKFPESNINLDNVVNDLFSQSKRNEVAHLDKLGLIKFIDYLNAKLQSADDRIDFGFLQAQTNIYRLRQLMLGTAGASRLATSTALADIAQGDTAVATREQLNEYANLLKNAGAATGANTLKAAKAPSGAAAAASAAAAAKAFNFSSAATQTIPTSVLNSTNSFVFTPEKTTNFQVNLPVSQNQFVFSGNLQDQVRNIPSLPISDELVKLQTDSQQVQFTTNLSSKLFQPAQQDIDFLKEGIRDQSYIVGKTFDFRTVTVAERLTNPPPNETKVASSAGKHDVLKSVKGLDLDLDLNLDDIQVRGLVKLDENKNPVYLLDAQGKPVRPDRVNKKLSEMTDDDFRFVLQDPDPVNADEADFFSQSVEIAEHAIFTLRQVEGLVRTYRTAVARCQDTLIKLQAITGDADRRLKVIGDELAEARHDVSVTRALIKEEEFRISNINERRTRILNEHVPYLAFYRPRLSNLLNPVPYRAVNPGLVAAPLPTCLSRGVSIPPDLRAMVDLFSDAPLKWLKYVLPLLDRLNNVTLLQETLVSAKNRALVKFAATPKTLAATTNSALGMSINKTFVAQQSVVMNYRAQTAQLNLANFANLGWKSTRDNAVGNLSLGDLRDAPHGRTDIINEATAELDNIAHVAGCLYESFGGVLPRIRLEWAERLSQYDEEVSLRNLANLPRWGEIEYLDRREMQSLVDWLYSRVDANEREAIAMCDDVVRVAILLASHAPVNEIIAGNVKEEATVIPGSNLKLNVDLSKVNIGMGVLVYKGADIVAHAVVDDLTAGIASAKVTKILPTATTPVQPGTQPGIKINEKAIVQLTHQPALMSALSMTLIGKK